MWKEIRSSIISAVITIIITGIGSVIVSYYNSPAAKVTLGYFKIDNENYVNSIMIKNVKKDEYLNEFDIIVDSNIQINDVKINEKKISVKDNIVKVNSLNPDSSIIVWISTNSKLDKNNTYFAKNGQKFDLNYFNEYTNIYLYTIVMIIIYAIINFLISLKQDIANARIMKDNNERKNKIEEMLQKNEEYLQKIVKKSNAQKTLYIKEMSDMERELNFYKNIIINICSEKITKEELENLISRKLKTFTKKHVKHLSYEDVYNIILKAVDDN